MPERDHMPPELAELLEEFLAVARESNELPEEDTPMGWVTRQFFIHNWENCRDGLLAKTDKLRVEPEPVSAPRRFRFEADCPYKAKRGPQAPVTLEPGPVRGLIVYRPDLHTLPKKRRAVAVMLDDDLAYFHPNFSRRQGMLCIGELPPGPFPLDALLENHLYPILTYQNRKPSHPADKEAARFFALEPTAMEGLEPAKPLY